MKLLKVDRWALSLTNYPIVIIRELIAYSVYKGLNNTGLSSVLH